MKINNFVSTILGFMLGKLLYELSVKAIQLATTMVER